ncbi:hypothetical protein Bbelb_156700, partial [Branchiostoma belcheri]
AGCVHYLTGVRGEVSSATDATSDYCEWVIRTDENRLILINFDVGEWRRGSHNCSATIMTFHDGSSANSNIIDTFCGDYEEREPAIPDVSTASTGNQLRFVFNHVHGNLTQHRTEFELTFTTREIEQEPAFDERTFVPQTEREFNSLTATDELHRLWEGGTSKQEFVQFKFAGLLQLTQEQVYPYGYKTYNKTPSGGSVHRLLGIAFFADQSTHGPEMLLVTSCLTFVGLWVPPRTSLLLLRYPAGNIRPGDWQWAFYCGRQLQMLEGRVSNGSCLQLADESSATRAGVIKADLERNQVIRQLAASTRTGTSPSMDPLGKTDAQVCGSQIRNLSST